MATSKPVLSLLPSITHLLDSRHAAAPVKSPQHTTRDTHTHFTAHHTHPLTTHNLSITHAHTPHHTTAHHTHSLTHIT